MMKEKQKKEDGACILEVLKWYDVHGRHDLIWRKKITAYSVLVSEIMLQQTQVSRVLLKYKEWMRKYPTLGALSKSDLKDVLILWQGLGYQRRAKALLTIARENSIIPRTYDELLLLSGVGTYTASAVCAFAYDTFAHPVLETNIRTVLIEFFHQGEESVHDGMLYDDLSRLESHKQVRVRGARHWYYALMDYGAYLKENKISHNKKSRHYTVQTPYKGSLRELRAKVLFAITHSENIPLDSRLDEVLKQLSQEKFIQQNCNGDYILV